MSGVLDPALLALSGGSAALASIYLYEHRRESRMREGRVARRLLFPVGVTERQAVDALASLVGAGENCEFVLEVRATSDGIAHFFHAPAGVADASSHQLSASIPGLRVDADGARDEHAGAISTLAVRVYVPGRSLLRTDEVESANRGLLAQLARLKADEHVRAYLAVRPAAPQVTEAEPESAVARERQRRLRQRIGTPTLAIGGLLVTRADSQVRARALLDGIGQSLRGRHAQGGPLRLTYERTGRRMGSLPKTSRRAGGITATELAGLCAWPLGDVAMPQVTLGATRPMLASRSVARGGLRLFTGRDVMGARPISLTPAGQRLHQFLVGPTGAGKSTLIASEALDSIAMGHAGLVVDPKDGSLIRSILDRVPNEHRDRVVVLDPANRTAPVGLDLFATGDADLRAEAITGTLRAIYAPQGAFGVRAEHYIALGVRTVAVLPNPSLLLLGRLFTDPALRQRAVARLNDPVLQMAWAAYNDLSIEAQREHVAAPLNRIMGLLQRPSVRATLAQPRPRLNLEELWQRRGWLLVDLSPGVLGEGAARLLGAIAGHVAWSTLEARARVSEAARVPTTLVFDELQGLADLPVSIERLAERSRAYAGHLIVATQAASRLPTPLADAIFGNFATLIAFKAGAAESQRLARELPGLDARDLMALGAYEVAARVATGTGTGTVTLTGRTEPLPPVKGNAEVIRSRSAERYGTPMAELERAIAEQLGGATDADQDRPAAGRARRPS